MAQYITRMRTASGDLQIDYNELANLPNIQGVVQNTLNNSNILQGTDSTLTKSGKAADAKAVGDALAGLNNGGPSSRTVFATVPRGLSTGDVAGDGVIDQYDLDLLYDYIIDGTINPDKSSITDAEVAFATADVDRNNDVDETDVQSILSYINGVPDTTFCANARDYYGNWHWDSTECNYYYDVPVSGMQATDSAILHTQPDFNKNSFISANCITNAIRVRCQACPTHSISCAITYAAGDGTVFIANSVGGSGMTIHTVEVSSEEEIANIDFSKYKPGELVLIYMDNVSSVSEVSI